MRRRNKTVKCEERERERERENYSLSISIDSPHAGYRFRHVKKIGEGTFSLVFKAEILLNGHVLRGVCVCVWTFSLRAKFHTHSSDEKGNAKYVAIKQIAPTSGPKRTLKEIQHLTKIR